MACQVKFGTTALANLSSRASERLSQAIAADSALADVVVSTCCALPSAVAGGGVWEPESAAAAVLGICRLLALCPDALLQGGAATALSKCWSDALGFALQAAAAVGPNEVDLASAEDGVAVLSQFAAGIRGLASTPAGSASARQMLLQMAAMLQTAAAAWTDDDVAAAVAELLYRAEELVADPNDELFDWLAQACVAIHGHHQAIACGSVEQLVTRWGAAAVEAGAPTRASAAVQHLATLVQGTMESQNGEAVAAGLLAAEAYLANCLVLIGGGDASAASSHFTSWFGGCAAASSAAESATLSAALRFLGGVQANCTSPEFTGAPSHAGLAPGMEGALAAQTPAIAGKLASQLCGHCDDYVVSSVAKTLHWLLTNAKDPTAMAAVRHSLNEEVRQGRAAMELPQSLTTSEDFVEWAIECWQRCR